MEANVPLTLIENDLTRKNNVELFLLREDLIHPAISGNKWRKLKYNILEYYSGQHEQIVTFGGAFSNHIAATAAAGKEFGIPTIGIIRGESTSENNSTLLTAKKNGMQLEFVTREIYRKKQDDDFLKELQHRFPRGLLIPEGGSSNLGFKGCSEIIPSTPQFDVVSCAIGTGCTFAGIISSLQKDQYAIGFPVLKGANYLEQDIERFLQENTKEHPVNWHLDYHAHYGGYGRFSSKVCDFIRSFQQDFTVKLDPIYTGKMMCRLFEMLENRELKNKKVLAIHTGGLQGVRGYQQRYRINIFDEQLI